MAARESSRNSGFTLVEVVVGFVILSLAAATLTGALSGGLSASGKTGRQIDAVERAENAMARAEADGLTQAAYRFRDAPFETRVTVRPAADEPRHGFMLMHLDATVFENGEPVTRLTTMRLRKERDR